MRRQIFRVLIALMLVVLTIVAAMLWSSEYASNPDPKARFEMEAAKLTRDHDDVWLELHLKKSGEEEHDLMKQVRLLTADGVKHDAADTTFAGTAEEGFTDIWLKFWLPYSQLVGELSLEINEGVLEVKASESVPSLENGEERVLRSADWEKSWLGF